MPARPHAQRRPTRLQDLTGSGRGGRPRYQKETFILEYITQWGARLEEIQDNLFLRVQILVEQMPRSASLFFIRPQLRHPQNY